MTNEVVYRNCQIKIFMPLFFPQTHAHPSQLNFTLISFTCALGVGVSVFIQLLIQKPLSK